MIMIVIVIVGLEFFSNSNLSDPSELLNQISEDTVIKKNGISEL